MRRMALVRHAPGGSRRLRRTNRIRPTPNHNGTLSFATIVCLGRRQVAWIRAGLAVRFCGGIRGGWPRAAARITLASTETARALFIVVIIISAIHREETSRVGRRGNRCHVVAVCANTMRARAAVPLRVGRARCPSGRIGVSMRATGVVMVIGQGPIPGTAGSFPWRRVGSSAIGSPRWILCLSFMSGCIGKNQRGQN